MTAPASTGQLRMVRAADSLDIDLDALQGSWSEEQYLALTRQTNRLIEFTDGVIEMLPMPTRKHQAISLVLVIALLAFVRPRGGAVFYAPLRLRVRPGAFREPDIMLLCDARDPRNQNEFWLGGDLVVEIVSPDHPERDTVEKPRDYAQAGIPEYWIVNPIDETITVLALEHDVYSTFGVFRRNEQAVSRLLEGFAVSVDAVFDAA